MNKITETEFDLEKLFLPAWAQEPAGANPYASFKGEERRFDDRGGDRRGGRRPRDGGGGGGRGRGPRPGGPGQGSGGRPQGSGQRQEQRGPGGDRGPRGRFDRRGGPQRSAPPRVEPLPQLNVTFLPDEATVESMARQIKLSGRAYPVFDIAHLFLKKPDKQRVRFDVIKKPDGEPVQPLYLCALDDTLWLSEEEVMDHLLKHHFNTFYQTERIPTDPPKGTYTFVAQCGMSGVILGPPNYHDYQNQLRKLHQERFSRMPFDMFKSRVKIVKDEATVKKWMEDQSFRSEYVCLNVPEAMKLNSREEVEKHFREVHVPNIVSRVDSHIISGEASRNLRSPELQRLVRSTWEGQQRFPLQLVTSLSQQFAGHGLQFFKVNKNITHVAVARPHYLDLEATPVSDGVKKIVDFINAHPRCSRRQVLDGLAPAPAVEAAPATPVEGAEAPAAPAQPQATPEQSAIISDLHWLVHQGHVIEFANGTLETAKKPKPRPVPEKKAKVADGQPATAENLAEVPNAAVQEVEPQTSEFTGEAGQPSQDEPAATSVAASEEQAPESLISHDPNSDARPENVTAEIGVPMPETNPGEEKPQV